MDSEMSNPIPVMSVVITTHNERLLVVPTLRSVAQAAERASVPCELIVVLDNADDQTTLLVQEFSKSFAWANIQIIRASLGDSGSARRAGVNAAQGRYVAVIDGDDLVSANYFKVALETLRSRPDAIVHPEFILSFGARDLIWRVFPTEYPGMNFRLLLEHNPWPSSHVAARETINRFPYEVLPPSEGFGPEDWVWNLKTSAEGVSHLPALGTAFFYRVKALRGVNNQHSSSILPKVPIDDLRRSLPAIDGKQISHHLDQVQQTKTNPQKVAGVLKSTLRPIYRALTWWMNPSLLRRIKAPIYKACRDILRIDSINGPRLRSMDSLNHWIELACDLEPALSNAMENVHGATIWQITEGPYSVILATAIEELRGYDAIVAVPWIGNGGADKVALNYAQVLQKSTDFRGKIAILTLHDPSRTDVSLIPAGIPLVRLPKAIRSLHPDLIDRLVASIVIQVEPKLILAINGFDVVNAMRQFGSQMTLKSRIFTSLFSWDLTTSGYPTNPITDDAERDHLAHISGFITDNPVTASLLHDRLGISTGKILSHAQPVSALAFKGPSKAKVAQHEYTNETPFTVIWPHRIDREKRPDSLLRIAKESQRRGLPIQFEVWGSAVLQNSVGNPIRAFQKAGIRYRGPFSGGLSTIPGIEDYDAMLLTSQNEGLPNVLVEAQLAQLPIVASGVGGVPHIVRHMDTGLLTEGPDDIDGFVDSLETLLNDSDLRSRLTKAGYAHASVAHSWPVFEAQVSEEILAKLSQIEAS